MLEDRETCWRQIEIYREYLKKISSLLTQLQAVENMDAKAGMELSMLESKTPDSSRAQYRDRLLSTHRQCACRLEDMHEQLRLIQAMKEELEAENPLLRSK